MPTQRFNDLAHRRDTAVREHCERDPMQQFRRLCTRTGGTPVEITGSIFINAPAPTASPTTSAPKPKPSEPRNTPTSTRPATQQAPSESSPTSASTQASSAAPSPEKATPQAAQPAPAATTPTSPARSTPPGADTADAEPSSSMSPIVEIVIATLLLAGASAGWVRRHTTHRRASELRDEGRKTSHSDGN